MLRVKTKICGITNLEDAKQAESVGADALGFVFYDPSPRNVTKETAAQICASLNPFTTAVGLFVDEEVQVVESIIASTKLQLLQFHGDESRSYCESFQLPYIKAVRVRHKDDFEAATATYPSALGLLVDTYVSGVAGGTGKAFDWSLLPSERTSPLILAGGLNPENVRRAIDVVRPYAVDVSGGVEQSKGKKDPNLVSSFIKEVSSGG